jgi:D-alanine-D-alanine ligase
MTLKIALLYGGESSEREVSIKTSNAVHSALKKLGHDVTPIDIMPGFEEKLKDSDFDLAFISVHGSPGEDGILQGILEFMKIPYTGSPVLGSAVAMDKVISKRLFIQSGLKTPNFLAINFDVELAELRKHIANQLKFPIVLKPSKEGSSVGLSISHNSDELLENLKKSTQLKCEFLAEEYIEGKELTVSILGSTPNALPIIQIVPKGGVYDFKAKYTKGETEFLVPAPLDEQLTKQIQEMAVTAFKITGCRDFGRVDFILSKDNIPYVLEVNTIPGMTETSLLPKAAGAIGIGFGELCELIIKMALK